MADTEQAKKIYIYSLREMESEFMDKIKNFISKSDATTEAKMEIEQINHYNFRRLKIADNLLEIVETKKIIWVFVESSCSTADDSVPILKNGINIRKHNAERGLYHVAWKHKKEIFTYLEKFKFYERLALDELYVKHIFDLFEELVRVERKAYNKVKGELSNVQTELKGYLTDSELVEPKNKFCHLEKFFDKAEENWGEYQKTQKLASNLIKQKTDLKQKDKMNSFNKGVNDLCISFLLDKSKKKTGTGFS